jgi:ribulose-phosphate 3-epimerase
LGRIKIYPSLLAADFSCLAEQIRCVEEAGADGLHLDIMDGHFVPNISFGPVVIRSIRKITRLPFWAHLMIEEPEKYIEAFQRAGVEGIVVHAEIQSDLSSLAAQIHGLGLEAGVSLNPETGTELIKNVLDQFERIMIMTVRPGFGGQSFMETSLKKISALKDYMISMNTHPLFEVDGGVDVHTAGKAAQAGGDILIAGSAIFHDENPGKALHAIRLAAESDRNGDY